MICEYQVTAVIDDMSVVRGSNASVLIVVYSCLREAGVMIFQ